MFKHLINLNYNAAFPISQNKSPYIVCNKIRMVWFHSVVKNRNSYSCPTVSLHPCSVYPLSWKLVSTLPNKEKIKLAFRFGLSSHVNYSLYLQSTYLNWLLNATTKTWSIHPTNIEALEVLT